MYSAFQSNAFQNNAFQILRGSTPAPVTTNESGGYIADAYAKYKPKPKESLEELRAVQEQIDREIAQAERLEAERKARVAKQQFEEISAMQAELEAGLQEHINRLRIERVWLMRRIDDEEAIAVLLLSMPFH